jgi:hypothetical protein
MSSGMPNFGLGGELWPSRRFNPLIASLEQVSLSILVPAPVISVLAYRDHEPITTESRQEPSATQRAIQAGIIYPSKMISRDLKHPYCEVFQSISQGVLHRNAEFVANPNIQSNLLTFIPRLYDLPQFLDGSS